MEKRVLGQKIKYIRKSQKITSEQLAGICNVNAGHMRQIEAGMRLPSLNLFIAVCNALKVSPEYLLEHELKEHKRYDGIYEQITEKLDKLPPRELELWNRLLETYVLELGYMDE